MSKTKYVTDTEDFYQKAPCGFLTCDGEGRIVGVNDTLLQWTGRERKDVEGLMTLSALLTTGSRIFAETHIIPLLKMQGYVNEVSLAFLGVDDAAIPTLVSAYRAANTKGSEEYFRLAIVDYTVRKRFEQELIEARIDAERSARLLREMNKDLERFAFVASHDLQAPLNSISGLIQILATDEDLLKNAETAEIFEAIIRSAQRMKMMINDLLAYRRLDHKADISEPVSLQMACVEAVENLNADIRANSVQIKLIEDLPKVRGVHIQLVRLFQNLFSNAIKYRSAAPPVIEVNAEIKGKMVLISVTDNGIGFEPDKAEVIFGFMERLQTKDRVEGTGLGLTSCRRIAEMHGGLIWAESRLGKGSTFFIELPAD